MADDWEESIVYVELCGVSGTQLFPEGISHKAEILGLASERPVMQINGHTLAGHYEDTVGTHMFIAEDKENSTAGGEGSMSSAQTVDSQYVGKTEKKLVMQPAFLVEKASKSQSSAATASSTGTTDANLSARPSTDTHSSAPETEEQSSEAAT